MASFEITCITKKPPGTHPEHIVSVCLNTGECFSVADIIKMIRNGIEFIVKSKTRVGTSAKAIIAIRERREYIRTTPDDTTSDNLLELPDCPKKK